jgi:hypothetical protein
MDHRWRIDLGQRTNPAKRCSAVGILRVRCVPNGGHADPGSCQCHSRHGVRRPEHRDLRRDRRRRVDCARWVVGEPNFGSVHEPRAHIRPGPRRNRLHELLGVGRGPTCGCSSRSGCRMGAPWCRRRPRRLRCRHREPFSRNSSTRTSGEGPGSRLAANATRFIALPLGDA